MLINAFLVQGHNGMFSYNDYLKECVNKSPNIKEIIMCAKILGDSKRITAVFSGGELNVWGATFILKDFLKRKEIFSMAKKICMSKRYEIIVPVLITWNLWKYLMM